MYFITSKYLLGKRYSGISLWPFVVIRHKKLLRDRTLFNHERIHLRQQVEMLVIPFYFCYLLEFLVRYIYYGNAFTAYKNISFEREAYAEENHENYLKKRRFWAFVKFLKV